MPTIDFTDKTLISEYFENSTTYSWDDPDHPNYDGVDFDKLASWLKRSGREMIESDAASQELTDQVEIVGYGLDGKIKPLAFSDRFAEPGIGVSDGDGRWNGQIDFYENHPEHGSNVSEKLELNFNGKVENVILTVGMLGGREGPDATPETGIWTALDSEGNVIKTGRIGPSESINGNEGTYGEYRFKVDANEPVSKIWIEATGFGYGTTSGKNSNAYREQDAAGNGRENNSDIGLAAVSYDRLTYGDDPEPPVDTGGDAPEPPADPVDTGSDDPEPPTDPVDTGGDGPEPQADPVETGGSDSEPLTDTGGVILGGSGNDTIRGSVAAEEVRGLLGNDTIYASSGYDTIYGGAGNDLVWGGNGNDTAYLGLGNDVFHDNGQNNQHGQDIVFAGRGDDTVYGGGGDDEFHGMIGNDHIRGGIGSDTIYAGAGYDTVFGGAGNDLVWGGNGRDTVFLGLGDDVFYDNAQNDENAHDRVFAGQGDDVINVGGGDNIITGGSGEDTFHFTRSVALGENEITDFTVGEDTLQFSGLRFADLDLIAAGNGVRVDWDDGSVELQNIGLASISEDDFSFV